MFWFASRFRGRGGNGNLFSLLEVNEGNCSLIKEQMFLCFEIFYTYKTWKWEGIVLNEDLKDRKKLTE